MLRGVRVLLGLGVLSTLSSIVGCQASSDDGASTGDAIVETDCAHSSSCVVAQAALKGSIKEKLASEIDSGWLEKGPIKVRTTFTLNPPKDEPLFLVEMPKGATLEASWSPATKGSISIRPRADKTAMGDMKVHYTLIPTLAAEIYGVTVNYDSTQLLEKLTDRDLNYDAKSDAQIAPWGFAGAQTTVPAPKLEDSTLFGLAFADLGVDSSIAEGQLAIQAVARPTFTYKTKSIGIDSSSVSSLDGTAKIPVGDYDSVDVIARVDGQLDMAGDLDVRPVVVMDTVAGVPTLGLLKYSFSVANKPFQGTSAVHFDPANIHIPLPNVKVPTTPFSLGDAQSDTKLTKTVTVQNTGELAAVLQVTSSDPKFTVPSTDIKIDPKSSYNLEVAFQPEGSGASSATITVKSNDPDSPEQTFQVSANGPSDPDPVADAPEEETPTKKAAPHKTSESGCSIVATGTTGTTTTTAAPFALALGLGLLLARRRRAS